MSQADDIKAYDAKHRGKVIGPGVDMTDSGYKFDNRATGKPVDKEMAEACEIRTEIDRLTDENKSFREGWTQAQDMIIALKKEIAAKDKALDEISVYFSAQSKHLAEIMSFVSRTMEGKD